MLFHKWGEEVSMIHFLKRLDLDHEHLRMNVVINRDSVCLADDMYDHEKIYQIDDASTYEDLFRVLINDKYLPSISGNNVVWVLKSDYYDCILSYFTKTNKMSPGLAEKSLKKLFRDETDNQVKLEFKYYTSPSRWKEHINEIYDNNEYMLWRDGWTEEIKYCDYVMSLE